MKNLFLAFAMIIALPILAEEKQAFISQPGNNNVNNICQPKVIVNNCKKCNTCEKQKTKVIYKNRYIKSKPKIVYKTKVVTKEKIVEVKKKRLKNSIRVLGGYGPDGVSAHSRGTSAVATQDEGLVLGLGYTRQLTERVSAEVDVLNNETYLLGVGLNF